MNAPQPRPARGLPLGWILLAMLWAYALAIHHGVGPVPLGGTQHWWQPRGFLLDWLSATALGAWIDGPRNGLLVFSLPALVLVIGVWASTRAAVARALSLAALFATALFLFYGLGGNRVLIWSFFHWRGSAVMGLVALSIAAALCAAPLAASWLRQGWIARIALCLPIWGLVVLAQRDVTGTDPALPFAISPWPVVPVFALEIGVTLVAALIAVSALAAAGIALLRVRRGFGLALLGAALIVLGGAVATRVSPGTTLLWITLAIAAAALGALGFAGDAASPAARGRARAYAVGALLVGIPILSGTLLSARDYAVTRDYAAQQIIEALQRYYAREQAYPDALEQLVAAKDLPALPRPSVGFGLLERSAPGFTYENFGTSYLLEFSAPRWVQCAYNPPYVDEDPAESAADDAGGPDADAEAERGSWSCPSKPPELW